MPSLDQPVVLASETGQTGRIRGFFTRTNSTFQPLFEALAGIAKIVFTPTKFGCPLAVSKLNLLGVVNNFFVMNDGDFELSPVTPVGVIRRLVRVKGVDFEEDFLAQLIGAHFFQKSSQNEPKLSDAMSIYLRESDAGDRRKFTGDVLHVFNRFVRVIGDLPLSELRYVHACQFRDYLLSLDLKPVTVRKQTAI